MIASSPRARFAAELEGHRLDGLLAVAVSGGADSLALLLLAAEATPGGVIAATVDHGLRAEAAEEAALAGRVAALVGVPHTSLPVSVAASGRGIQAAAREARYQALEGWAREQGAAALLTAHHVDDQAETVLLRLARGAGLAGLAGVRRSRDLGSGLKLVRPLLDWRKAELEEVVNQAGLDPADDASNRDPRYDRTAARALLAREPMLDPRRLAHAATHLAEAEEALVWISDGLWRERMTGADPIELELGGLPAELRRRLLARALPTARGNAVAALMRRLDRAPVATLAGHVIRRKGERWTISPAPSRRRP